MIHVRPVTAADHADWLQMRCELWPDAPAAEHRADIERYFAGQSPLEACHVLLAHEAGSAVGFAELSIRPCAEGCRGPRIAYLEGWFVRAGRRTAGVGRALVAAAERWARECGCREFASDTEPDNDVSAAAHRALGFVDVGLVRCFRKQLGDGPDRPWPTPRP